MTSLTDRLPSFGSPLGVASLLVVAIGAGAYFTGPILDERIPTQFRHIDWVSYSSAARRFLAGEPLYITAQLAGPYRMADIAGLGYVYPPPSVLLFVPFLALGPTAWAIANALLFASGMAAIARREFGRYAGLALGVVLLASGLTSPYLDAMLMGNVSLGIAGLFAWAWALGRGSGPVGVVAAIGSLIKLHPFALAGWTRVADARRTIGLAVGVAGGLTFLTLPIVGVANWVDFGRAARNAVPLCGFGIDAVACQVRPVVGDLTTPILVMLSGLLVVAAIWARHDLVAFALIVTAVIVPHPEVFPHTFLLVEVLLFALVGSLVRHRVASPAAGSPAVAFAR